MASSANALRKQIETALAKKIPSALSPAPRILRSVTATGIAALDAILEGGLPSAAMTELVGPPCSGRTTVALACLSAMTQTGSVCAWIDVADALDPESAAASGVDLNRLLWIRCGDTHQRPAVTHPSAWQNAAGPIALSSPSPRHSGGGSPHPRSEGRDLPAAISAMLHAHGGLYDRQQRRKMKSAGRAVGTPGAANRPLPPRSPEREEQVNSDRLPARRGDNLSIAARCSEPQPRRAATLPSGKRLPTESTERSPDLFSARTSKPWHALDQALRATDLLLQAGGFSALVLDLGSTPPEAAWRIPLATWFRFRAACERTRVSLVLLTQHPCARSSAELVVRLEPGQFEAESKVMTGIRYCAATERSRAREANDAHVVPIRKQPQSVRPGQWKSEAAWAQMK